MGLIYVIRDKSTKETLITFPNGSKKTLTDSVVYLCEGVYKVFGTENDIKMVVYLPSQQTIVFNNDDKQF